MYVMWSNKMSRNSQLLILRYSQLKQNISFVFYCFEKFSTACFSGTNQPIFMGFSAKSGSKMPNATIQKTRNIIYVTSDSFCLIASHTYKSVTSFFVLFYDSVAFISC